MPRATTIVRRAAVRPDAVVDTISLDHAGRQAQHGHLHSDGGLHIDLALAKATALDD
ncbi:MAG: urease accessory protein UreE, partial [Methylobacterium sp.]